MKERLMEVLHYRRNLKALEKTRAVKPIETPLIEGNMPDLFEVFPSPFNAGEIIRRNHGK
jgi:hypothetical protein